MKKKQKQSKPPGSLGEQIQQVAAKSKKSAALPEIRSTDWLGALMESLYYHAGQTLKTIIERKAAAASNGRAERAEGRPQ